MMRRSSLAAGAAAIVAAMVCAACGRAVVSDPAAAQAARAEAPRGDDWMSFEKPDDAELRERLTPLQYKVTQEEGTEPAFANEYWDNKKPGIYVDVVSGEPLFSSLDKYESGTGWPSFARPIDADNVVTREDRKLWMVRTEVRSKRGGSHLGHVFDDGPAPTGQRFCMNSAALRFVPVDELEAQGYGEYLPLFGKPAPAKAAGGAKATASGKGDPASTADSGRRETAYLAGGCFWGVEELIRKLPGVLDTEAGYTGGSTDHPTYEQVHTGATGHAEAVKIVFDPERISYEDLLLFFFRMHDPTTKNRQGNDIGTQYRSAIFTLSDEQARVAERVRARVDASGRWRRPLTTEIVPAGEFWPAEDYHQDYLEKHPGGYTCHYVRDFDFDDVPEAASGR